MHLLLGYAGSQVGIATANAFAARGSQVSQAATETSDSTADRRAEHVFSCDGTRKGQQPPSRMAALSCWIG